VPLEHPGHVRVRDRRQQDLRARLEVERVEQQLEGGADGEADQPLVRTVALDLVLEPIRVACPDAGGRCIGEVPRLQVEAVAGVRG